MYAANRLYCQVCDDMCAERCSLADIAGLRQQSNDKDIFIDELNIDNVEPHTGASVGKQ